MSLYHEVRRLWCVDPKLSLEDLPEKLHLAILGMNDDSIDNISLSEIIRSYELKKSGDKYLPVSEMDFNLAHNVEWNAMVIWDDHDILAWWKAGPHLGCDGVVHELEFEPASRSPSNFSFSVGNLVPM